MKKGVERLLAAALAAILPALCCAAGVAEAADPFEAQVEEVEFSLTEDQAGDEETGEMAVAAPLPDAVSGDMAMAVEPVPMPAAAPASLAVTNKQRVTMNAGEVLQLTTALEGTAKWTSSKPKVATVDESGNVTAIREGKATIRAKVGKKAVKVKLKVVDPLKPTSVSLGAEKQIQINLQDSVTLIPILTPATAQASYTWKSSRKKVVAVDNGVLTPLSEGTSTITVKTHNKKSARVKVKVVDPYKPDSVALDVSGTVTLKPGESFTLTPSLSPVTARAAYTWKSSKPGVAAVDQSGTVTAAGKGTAKISVTTQNKKKASIKVRVVVDDPGLPMRMSASRYRYWRKYMSKKQFNAAYEAVRPYLEPLLEAPVQDQVYGAWNAVGNFGYQYTMKAKHYNDPYGLLVLGVASCAGTTRSVGFCLNLLGIDYRHAHENQWEHQWARVLVNGEWWICDGMGYCGPEGDPNRPIEIRDENGFVVMTYYSYMNG